MQRHNCRIRNRVDNNVLRDWHRPRGEKRSRPHSQTFRIIKTTNELGNKTRQKKYGKSTTTTHIAISEVLEQIATRGRLGDKHTQKEATVIVHKSTGETVKTQQKGAMQKVSKEEVELGMKDVHKLEAKLTHLDLGDLNHSGGEWLEYWLPAEKTSCEAVKLVQVQTAADMPPD